MLVTEEEAKKKWCPKAMAPTAGGGVSTVGPYEKNCIASGCMMWREEAEVRSKGGVGRLYGYCGLAGLPDIKIK